MHVQQLPIHDWMAPHTHHTQLCRAHLVQAASQTQTDAGLPFGRHGSVVERLLDTLSTQTPSPNATYSPRSETPGSCRTAQPGHATSASYARNHHSPQLLRTAISSSSVDCLSSLHAPHITLAVASTSPEPILAQPDLHDEFGSNWRVGGSLVGLTPAAVVDRAARTAVGPCKKIYKRPTFYPTFLRGGWFSIRIRHVNGALCFPFQWVGGSGGGVCGTLQCGG